MDPITRYAEQVVAREIVAGPGVRAACKRHLDDLKEGPKRGLRFDQEKAQLALDFFPEVLVLGEGQYAGKPFILQPWQQFVVGSLFGWIAHDGFRRFRMAYLEIGKGSGKTPLAAACGLYLMLADGEEGAEVFCAAVTKEQAGLAFRDAARMVQASPELSHRVECSGVNPIYNLAHAKSGSFMRPVSAEGKSLDGKRPHGVIVDELHEHDSDIVLEKLVAGFKGRRQPLLMMITNSGHDRLSVCFTHHQYANRVVSAKFGEQGFDDQYFAFVCALDDTDDPFESEDCWIKANPNLGVSIGLDYLRKQVREAKGMPSKASLVRRLNFCEWTDAANPWIERAVWAPCEVKEPIDLAKRSVSIGGDMSLSRDLSVLFTGSVDTEGVIECRADIWTAEDTLKSRSGAAGQPPWQAWVDAGFVHVCHGHQIRFSDIAARLAEISVESKILGVALDQYAEKFFAQDLEAIGLTVPIVAHPQGPVKSATSMLWMPRSIQLLEQRLHEKMIKVEYNPCVWWCVQNVQMESDKFDNRFFAKRDSRGPIDAVVALAMMVGLINAPVQQPQYDFRVYQFGEPASAPLHMVTRATW